MQITALGHSCVLLDFHHDHGGHTRILVDPWLTDHATGDAMGRFPRLRFEIEALGRVDAVFLSHAHCDHLDPYTLVRLWRELADPPVLLLPVSLAFLVPIFEAHLDPLDLRLIAPHEPLPFGGVELVGVYDVGLEPNNEDDVMVLVVCHGAERVLVEVDARLSLEHPGFRAYLHDLLCGPDVASAVFLTTENELTGTLDGRACATPEHRQAVADYALDEMVASVEALYHPVDDDDLWASDRLIRLIHGQGLAAPHELDPRWQHVLFPVRIDDRVRVERAVAGGHGHRHTIDRLTDGHTHTIEAGRVVARSPAEGLELLDHEDQRTYEPESDYVPDLPCAPVRADARDIDAQRARIRALLDHRFGPYLHGVRRPPVLHLLAAYGGTYRIRVHYGSGSTAQTWDYALGFAAPVFTESLPDDDPQEEYWANDLDDFLDGRCDEFTGFCRTQLPAEAMRLWTHLATPLLHADLVAKRVALHFDRASQGLGPGDYVLPLYGVGEHSGR